MYVFYDPPHLLKCVRNNVKQFSKLHVRWAQRLCWRYVRALKDVDNQIESKTIDLCSGDIPAEVFHAAAFIKKIYSLFDIFN